MPRAIHAHYDPVRLEALSQGIAAGDVAMYSAYRNALACRVYSVRRRKL